MDKKTSHGLAAKASEILRDKSSSNIQKSLAGSILSQSSTGNVTSDKMATKASQVLNSDKYSNATKSLAGSALSQAK